ncbi:SpoIIE family protein phosphatase [Kitasatospora sp. DSM 101779]|uniref:SpoIIE family protein phosphatase n=1 Tax=Kitasatospora sp. DSM 101779 TaxID=2853165 RepID=UPI0021D89B3E|nr:SpoIIE family protein phosphatase [Kitasatospora sp. DSM 101779]MCU7821258.1 SpoIIE family protein phosphatase [Kitasatospora sp. DSM 101779]
MAGRAEHHPAAPPGAEPGTTARPAERSVLQATVDRLRAEVEGLQTAMRTRAVIEQAKGMLAEREGGTPDQAFDRLVQLSQDTNRKLVDIAAEVVGVAAPLRDRAGEPDRPDPATPAAATQPEERPGPAPGSDAAPPPGEGLPARGLAARYHLAAAAMASAGSTEDLARLLHDTALAPLGVTAAVLALLEPDGALRLVGSHGVSAHRLSQWQRIPPVTALPLTEAAQSGTAVWVATRKDFAARYPDVPGEDLVPGRTVCALPLRTGGRVIGAMKLGWAEEYRPDPEAERYLAALAALCAAELERIGAGAAGPGRAAPVAEPWFRAVLDALLDPVLILGAVRDPGGGVTDLRVEHANAATVDLAGRTADDMVGRRVTELYPGMVASGTFGRLLDVAATGAPYEGGAERFEEVVDGAVRASEMTLHATPFLDGVLVSWRAHDERDRRETQLAQAQRLARLGTWSWEPGSTRLTCSPEVPRLLGLPDDGSGGIGLAQALAAVVPGDRDGVRAAAAGLLAGAADTTLEFRVGQEAETRSLRVLATAVRGLDRSAAVAVRGVVQDVTGRRRAEQALAGTRTRLAEQRRRADTEHRAVLALQRALMDAPAGPPTPGLHTAARYLPAGRGSKVGGDWWDVLALPDGTVLVVVGDVSGHGLPAAAGMANLRHALRGLAYTGAPPEELLARLNRMLCHERGNYTATAVCGRLDPATLTLDWARAGHLPPVVTRGGGEARLLEMPDGMLLGAVPGARYRPARLRLEPGDTLLLYTDGLVERRGGDLGEGVHRLVEALRDYRADDIEGCLDHVLRRLGAPNPLDDTCLVGLRLT